MLLEATVFGLSIDPASNTPIVMLKIDDDRVIPIWIGLLEASAIASEMRKVTFDRPMTHDLFKDFMQALACRITSVEVCDIRDNTFYARIHVASNQGAFSLDARPSDAIALALRFEAPVYVDNKVAEQAGQTLPAIEEGEAVDQSEEGKKWADYLNSLSPEDFGKV